MFQVQWKTISIQNKILTAAYSNSYRYRSYVKNDYSEYFKLLNIKEDSDQNAARESFLKLAKKYHPDSNHPEANSETFQKIEDAYKKILEKFSHDRRNINDCEGEYGLYYEQKKSEENHDEMVFDIEHTAPQHRQYLSFEGIGTGTPFQRQKQFTKYKAMRAAENVIDYKVQRLSEESEDSALVAKDKKKARNVRTRYGIDRLVEDKIQESMARGDFDNLSNAGKPLKFQNHNPFVDNVTHKLNEVLIDNGYAPEWIMLEKEIRHERLRIKKRLENCRCKLGSCPINKKEMFVWTEFLSNLKPDIEELNKKIDKYNLVVPIMSKQTVHYPLTKISEKILQEGKSKDHIKMKEILNDEDIEGKLQKPTSSQEFGLKSIISILIGK